MMNQLVRFRFNTPDDEITAYSICRILTGTCWALHLMVGFYISVRPLLAQWLDWEMISALVFAATTQMTSMVLIEAPKELVKIL